MASVSRFSPLLGSSSIRPQPTTTPRGFSVDLQNGAMCVHMCACRLEGSCSGSAPLPPSRCVTVQNVYVYQSRKCCTPPRSFGARHVRYTQHDPIDAQHITYRKRRPKPSRYLHALAPPCAQVCAVPPVDLPAEAPDLLGGLYGSMTRGLDIPKEWLPNHAFGGCVGPPDKNETLGLAR